MLTLRFNMSLIRNTFLGLCVIFCAQEVAAQVPLPSPAVKPMAMKAAWFGRVSRKQALRQLDLFWTQFHQKREDAYIINYGSNLEIARREKLILESMGRMELSWGPRVTFVRGGRGDGLKTVIWFVPDGADLPSP